jgi:DNA-binding winged helix-turn-helix (wHTH) protein
MNPGRVVTKDELLKAVWPESFVEENNLTQHISALRKVFAERAGYIVTVPGRGYHFAAPVHEEQAAGGARNGQIDNILIQRVRERASFVLEETSTEPIATAAAAFKTSAVHRISIRLIIWTCIAGACAAIAGAAYLNRDRFAKPQRYRQVMVGDFLNVIPCREAIG